MNPALYKINMTRKNFNMLVNLQGNSLQEDVSSYSDGLIVQTQEPNRLCSYSKMLFVLGIEAANTNLTVIDLICPRFSIP